MSSFHPPPFHPRPSPFVCVFVFFSFIHVDSDQTGACPYSAARAESAFGKVQSRQASERFRGKDGKRACSQAALHHHHHPLALPSPPCHLIPPPSSGHVVPSCTLRPARASHTPHSWLPSVPEFRQDAAPMRQNITTARSKHKSEDGPEGGGGVCARGSALNRGRTQPPPSVLGNG